MKSRRLIAILCAVCILSCLFISCKKQDGNTTDTTADGTTQDDTTKYAGPALTLESGAVDPSAIEFKNKDLYTAYSGGVRIELSDKGSASGTGYKLADGELDITADGTYILTGKLADGHITVNAPKEADVRLVLEGVDIYCTYCAPIYVKSADKVIISLPDGFENKLEDKNTSYESDGSKISAVIYSHDSVSINGTGTLNIKAASKDGITTKDTLKITGGNINVEASDDGIIGRDRVLVNGGNITVKSVGDGIKTTNDEDSAIGYVYIGGGKVNVTSDGDAIVAQSSVLVAGGELDLKTGGGAANISEKGTIVGDGFFGKYPANNRIETNALSMKGIKAELYLDISGGVISIDTADDALHSDGTVRINNGNINIKTGDDAIFAESRIEISGAKITVAQSYEGIEAASAVISGGLVSITTSCGGMNSTGAEDGRIWADTFNSVQSVAIAVSGGEVTLNGSAYTGTAQ